MKDLILMAVAVTAFFGLIVGALVETNAVGCERRWADSGLKAKYRIGAGCMVQRKDGTWFPAESIREVSP